MTKTRKSKKNNKELKEYYGIIWILPAIVLILVFCIYPAISALMHAFTNWDGTNSTFIGLDNFTRLLKDSLFWKSFKTMLFLMVVCMVLGNLATLSLSEMMFNLKSKKFNALFRFLFVLPALIPGIVIIFLWGKMILNGESTSIANKIIGFFGADPIGWFNNEKTVLLSIIIYNFPWIGGTSFLIYLAGLNNISESAIEASKLDGCGVFKRIIFIDLPLIKGQIKYFLILGVIGGIQGYSLQYAITNGGPGINYPSMVPGYYLYTRALNYSEYGYACAIGFVLFIIILTVTIINNKYFKSSED